MCQGQSVPISENETLFNLIGTTYGGDGQETFNLPDLQAAPQMHMGKGPAVSQTYQQGEAAGVEASAHHERRSDHTHSFCFHRSALALTHGQCGGRIPVTIKSVFRGCGDCGSQRTIDPATGETSRTKICSRTWSLHHHFPFRGFPVADIRREPCRPICRRNQMFAFNFAPKAGPCDGSCCPSRRTRRCSLCSNFLWW